MSSRRDPLSLEEMTSTGYNLKYSDGNTVVTPRQQQSHVNPIARLPATHVNFSDGGILWSTARFTAVHSAQIQRDKR